MSGQNATDNPANSLLERLLGWLPGWLGFVLIILAGVAAIVVGAIAQPNPNAGFIAFGVAAIASSILAWWSGAKSEPRANPFDRSFGGIVSNVDGWVWLVVLGLFGAAVVVAILTRP
jgi:uncharacterized membrane protein HdeD (DUF308 family)